MKHHPHLNEAKQYQITTSHKSKNNIAFIIKQLLMIFIGIGINTVSYALAPNDFTQIEYHLNTGVGDTLPYAADKLTDNFKQTFNFVELEDDISVNLVSYIDTADRAFNAHNILIRVREDVNKPKKSKITVKIRANNPGSLGNIQNYDKAEIDFTNGKLVYSASFDVSYTPTDINIKALKIESIFQLLKQNSATWSIVGPIYEQNKDKLQQTAIMKVHNWEGHLKDERFEKLEVDFQLWTPDQGIPKITLAEFSFKGKISNKPHLEEAYNFLSSALKKVNLPSENQDSKTSNTFKISKGFKDSTTRCVQH